MAFHSEEGLLFSGQISGTEGYVSPAASGYVAGANTAPVLRGQEPLVFPTATMIGALCWHVTTPQRVFQPMKPSFGLLPPLEKRARNKRVRHQWLSERALCDLDALVQEESILMVPAWRGQRLTFAVQ